jgi:hypothetical protein
METSPRERRPLVLRGAVLGAGVCGVVGGIVGLVIGLVVHPATAWFAIVEIGLPAALLGGLGGLAIGAIASVLRWGGSRPLV